MKTQTNSSPGYSNPQKTDLEAYSPFLEAEFSVDRDLSVMESEFSSAKHSPVSPFLNAFEIDEQDTMVRQHGNGQHEVSNEFHDREFDNELDEEVEDDDELENEFNEEDELDEDEFEQDEFYKDELDEDEFDDDDAIAAAAAEDEFYDNEFDRDDELDEDEFEQDEFYEDEFDEDEFEQDEFYEDEFEEDEFQDFLDELDEDEFDEDEAAIFDNFSDELSEAEVEPLRQGILSEIFANELEERFVGRFFGKVSPPSPVADTAAAVPPFNFFKRLSMPAKLLTPAQNADAIRWNKSKHPRVSGLDPNHIRTDLTRYVNFTYIKAQILNYNRSHSSAPIAMGSAPIDAVFVEAVHQFQAKCFFETSQIDGKAGESTLDSLGLVKRKGLNDVDKTNENALKYLKKLDVARETGGEFNSTNWFKSIVNPSFLGWRFERSPGIHLILARHLRIAERWLLSQPKYRGMTPVELGRALGFDRQRRGEPHKGARPRTTKTRSMHIFGLACDIMYSGNPWVRGDKFFKTLKRSALLMSGVKIEHRTTGRFLHSLGSNPNLSTQQIHQQLARRNDDFRKYLALANNQTALQTALEERRAQSTSGIFRSQESLQRAVSRWQKQIRKDLKDMRTTPKPFKKNDRTFRDPLKGFLSLPLDLVIALRDKACLAWGAVDFGRNVSGDIMHFDTRTTGISAKIVRLPSILRHKKPYGIPQGLHPCLPLDEAPGQGGSIGRNVPASLPVSTSLPSAEPVPSPSSASTAQPSDPPESSSLFQRIKTALRDGFWTLALSLSIRSGQRDANKLTNMIFFARHPELNGRKLKRHEKKLIREWRTIRSRLVQPALRKHSSSSSDPAPSTSSSSRGSRISQTVLNRIANFDEIIDRVAAEENIDPNWIRGVIAAESGGKPNSGGGSTGYKGLMQAKRDKDQLDPETSIRDGAQKLRRFWRSVARSLRRHGINPSSLSEETMIRMTMVAYNAGPGTLKKAMGYAVNSGDVNRWMEPENFQRALIYYGAYSVRVALKRCLKGPNGATVLDEIAELANLSAETIRQRYHNKQGWKSKSLWNFIRRRISKAKKKWMKRNDLTFEQLQDQVLKLFLCAVAFKHSNLRTWYVDRVITYMQHYNQARS